MGGGLLLHTLLNNRVPKLVSKKVKKIHTMKINIKNPVYFCIHPHCKYISPKKYF